ncbi:hypothetical protein NM208_g12853 [Fusarium decemcellulare]|uniref:Uncharacterized protein n=1 Tax=Fusarium decemcellulare TaxID=57161 RepID=A0ACC1RNT2_9HYPO|nr:hypothetical protein NM208_g12853 [Fusarium decemcellulare]
MGSTSPPRVPSKGQSGNSSGHQFVEIEQNDDFSCESPENYRLGGFHPVKLGDTMNFGQYRIIAKLGFGNTWTRWLAVREEKPTLVAIKIYQAASRLLPTELGMSAIIARQMRSSLDHVQLHLDFFYEEGPNGNHTCLVHRPLIHSVHNAIHYLPEYRQRGRKEDGYPRYPTRTIKTILKQTLLGLETLHKCNMVHGGLRSDALLFETHELESADESELTQSVEADTKTLQRLDGKVDGSAPPYLTRNLHFRVGNMDPNITDTLKIKVCRIGESKSPIPNTKV